MNSNDNALTKFTTPVTSTAYMRVFENYLKSQVNLSQQAWYDLEKISKSSQVHKEGVLVSEGQVFNKEIFIVEGVIRAYTLDKEGHEKTTAFYQAYDFMNINTLRNRDGYSISTYQAIPDSVVIIFESDRFRDLLDKYPALMKLASLVKNQEVDRLKNRDDCLLQVSGVEKYLKFREYYPGIEDKIPHYYIASYLGISPVSLSRARKKIGMIRPLTFDNEII